MFTRTFLKEKRTLMPISPLLSWYPSHVPHLFPKFTHSVRSSHGETMNSLSVMHSGWTCRTIRIPPMNISTLNVFIQAPTKMRTGWSSNPNIFCFFLSFLLPNGTSMKGLPRSLKSVPSPICLNLVNCLPIYLVLGLVLLILRAVWQNDPYPMVSPVRQG